MPNQVVSSTVSGIEFIDNPYEVEPASTRTYDENTLEERINYILAEHPERAQRATENQRDFVNLCRRVFNGREGRWPTAQIQVELSRRLVEPITLHDFQ